MSLTQASRLSDCRSSSAGTSDGKWAWQWSPVHSKARTSKTPTSIYLANRGYKVANIPIVVESPPPPALFGLRRPLVVGLTTAPDRLIQVRRNRLLSLSQSPDTDYVDNERVAQEVKYARRMFADNGWPVIHVTRRSIGETAAAIMVLYQERYGAMP